MILFSDKMAAHGQQNGFLQRLESVHVVDCGDVRAPFPEKLLRAFSPIIFFPF